MERTIECAKVVGESAKVSLVAKTSSFESKEKLGRSTAR
jgi:hypothetical protein